MAGNGTLAVLGVDITAQREKLVADLRQAEQQVKTSAAKMEKEATIQIRAAAPGSAAAGMRGVEAARLKATTAEAAKLNDTMMAGGAAGAAMSKGLGATASAALNAGIALKGLETGLQIAGAMGEAFHGTKKSMDAVMMQIPLVSNLGRAFQNAAVGIAGYNAAVQKLEEAERDRIETIERLKKAQDTLQAAVKQNQEQIFAGRIAGLESSVNPDDKVRAARMKEEKDIASIRERTGAAIKAAGPAASGKQIAALRESEQRAILERQRETERQVAAIEAEGIKKRLAAREEAEEKLKALLAARREAAKQVADAETQIRVNALNAQGKAVEAQVLQIRAARGREIEAAEAAGNIELGNRLRVIKEQEVADARRQDAIKKQEESRRSQIASVEEKIRAAEDVRAQQRTKFGQVEAGLMSFGGPGESAASSMGNADRLAPTSVETLKAILKELRKEKAPVAG